MDRRQFIVAAGATAAVGVAGCLGDDGGGTGSPDGVVEAFLNADSTDDASDYLHSESQLTVSGDGEDGGEQDADIEVNNVEVTEEDLGEDAVREWLGSTFNEYGDDAISTIAGQSNAEVEADITATANDEESDQTYIFLVAEEDGDWQIVDFTFDMESMG